MAHHPLVSLLGDTARLLTYGSAAAYTPAALERSWLSTTMPLSTFKPAAAASSTRG